jgi:hypothetical protein
LTGERLLGDGTIGEGNARRARKGDATPNENLELVGCWVMITQYSRQSVYSIRYMLYCWWCCDGRDGLINNQHPSAWLSYELLFPEELKERLSLA